MNRTAILATILCLCALPAWGQVSPPTALSQPQEKVTKPLAGTVLDPAGKPVAGAKVWLLRDAIMDGYTGSPRITMETVSDHQGRFEMTEPAGAVVPARTLMVVARDNQGRIGGQMIPVAAPPNIPGSRGAAGPAKPSAEMVIRLFDVKDYQGRLVDTSGQPVAGATIRPRSISPVEPGERYSREILLPRVSDELAVLTGADGSFTVCNLLAQGEADLAIEADGFGKPQAWVNLETSATISIGRTGSVRVSLVRPATPKTAAVERAYLGSVPGRTPLQRVPLDRGFELHYAHEVAVGGEGTIQFDNVPAGSYMLRLDLSLAQVIESRPCYVDEMPTVVVKPGETTNISLVLKPSIIVTGRFVDQQTGKGVADVGIMIVRPKPSPRGVFPSEYSYFRRVGERSFMGGPPRSFEDGTFSFYARPGELAYQIASVPREYLRPSSTQHEFTVTEDMTLDPIALQRGNVVEGIVVDKAGDPVADARIFFCSTQRQSTLRSAPNLASDAKGRFAITGIPPTESVFVHVRTEKAVAEWTNVTPGELKEPLRIVVDEQRACTLRGELVNDAGQPIAGADVRPMAMIMFGDWGVPIVCETHQTDADGKFEVGGLWPGERYEVQVSARGYAKRVLRQTFGDAGEVRDFGTITLVAAGDPSKEPPLPPPPSR